ncbi:DeoR/GlpR family DNA-binding transcription regulator [Rhizobium sp. SG2393]|uniref:DeoR/GlpR family DNA-binding transcription regulator n=1 Tax=Rhizobium sp. SG2393 TaxID=3276279 RepID=UPI0036726339
MKKPKSIRQERILTELTQAPSLRVAELARRLDVSTETIRRDLDELTGQGLLNRTYGGAVRSLSTEPSVTERHMLFVAERERIARAAVQILKGARVLMIGSGATTVHTARRIAVEMRDITVLTHSFGVATVLAINPTIKVIILPGDYHATEGATVGAHTVSFLNGFYAEFAVLGASGLGPDGPSDALIECGAVYTTMMARSARTVVVADHSKHDRLFPARYAPWSAVGNLVTDKAPVQPLLDRLAANAVTLTLA